MEGKKLRYTDLVEDCTANRWKAMLPSGSWSKELCIKINVKVIERSVHWWERVKDRVEKVV